MTECVFCKIIDGTLPTKKIYEDEKTIAILDANPLAKLHCLVIPKNHSRNVFDIEPDDLSAVALTVRKVAKAVKETVNCDGVNILQNNERVAMQMVFHTHFHIIPRFRDDGIYFKVTKRDVEVDGELFEQLKDRVNSM